MLVIFLRDSPTDTLARATFIVGPIVAAFWVARLISVSRSHHQAVEEPR